METDYGAISLLPTVVVLALAIWSHRTIESVVAGAIVAYVLTSGWGFLGELSEAVLTVMQDRDTAWVLLVCALYGSFIALVVKGGGAHAFGKLVTPILLTTWTGVAPIFWPPWILTF